jgi:hypothetical protein
VCACYANDAISLEKQGGAPRSLLRRLPSIDKIHIIITVRLGIRNRLPDLRQPDLQPRVRPAQDPGVGPQGDSGEALEDIGARVVPDFLQQWVFGPGADGDLVQLLLHVFEAGGAEHLGQAGRDADVDGDLLAGFFEVAEVLEQDAVRGERAVVGIWDGEHLLEFYVAAGFEVPVIVFGLVEGSPQRLRNWYVDYESYSSLTQVIVGVASPNS